MALEIVRRIRGNVHGSIDVSALEDQVIAHPYFQRLRRIKQLAFLHYVFPGATHTRFEHSLGVMHMAGIAWDKLRMNQYRLCHSLEQVPDFAQIEKKVGVGVVHGLLSPTFERLDELFHSDYLLQVLRLAGLMHDLGHPPFSHSGERFLPTWAELLHQNPDLPAYLRAYIEGECAALRQRAEDPKQKRVRHEVLSTLMVEEILRDIYARDTHVARVDPRDVVAVMNPHIQPDANSPLLQLKAHGVLKELISGELDIDRMDYLLRDSRECGVVYGIFDAGRILDSLYLYYDPEEECHHVAIGFSGLAAFEDYLRARHSMYLQLYFHKTSVAAEAMMQHISSLIGGYHLPAKVADYGRLDEHNIAAELNKAGQALEEEKRDQVHRLTTDLLLHRRLWKRVYEVSGVSKQIVHSPELVQVRRWLEEMGIAYEQVSSSGSLTRFRPRRAMEKSHNYLRLVKKDERQIPRVKPIEDFSHVIHRNDSTFITRLYVDAEISRQHDIKAIIQKRLAL